MGCMLPPLEYYGLAWSARVGGRVVMTTRLLRGVGTARAKGEGERACDELGACVSSGAGVRACTRVRAAARDREGVGARRSIMVCPLRGNYAESCASVGGGAGYYGMSAPFVCLRGC